MTLGELLPLVAIAVAFWFLLIRPASVRRKEQARLVASLAPGQHVMTTAGVFGTLTAIEGERVRVEVAPGTEIEMLAVAVAQVVPAEPPAVEPDDESADGAPGSAGVEAGAGTETPGSEADRG
jgi:preprotein translocase subunit YajC